VGRLHHTDQPEPESESEPEQAAAPGGIAATGDGAHPAPDTQASLDQVLRDADVARRADHGPEG
jgi:hypothetical protein